LIASLDILKCLNYETLTRVAICPRGLPWATMIKHVSVGYKGVSFVTIYLDAENA
jgi:hypothetical protein